MFDENKGLQSPSYELIVVSGPEIGRRLIVDAEEVSIGRDASCRFQLHDAAVSRLHCFASCRNGSVLVRDAKSRWGTFVNGSRTDESRLTIGDRLLVGETEMLVSRTSGNGTTIYPPHGRTLPPKQDTPQRKQPRQESPADSPKHDHGDRIRDDEDVMRLLNTSFMDYHVESVITTARTGAIFRAFDESRKTEAALKIFWPRLFAEENELARFVRAMKSAIPVRHANIVRVYSAGRHRGVCYTASEIVDGESVAQLINRIGVCGMLDWRRVLRIAIDVAQGLEAADKHQIIHRNITPGNLLIRTQDDHVKLNDLVLAKAIAGAKIQQLTAPGEVLGDLVFMSPEQLGGDRPVDHRSDIYSLGAALYAMLTARPPLEGRNTRETIQLIEIEKPEPPTTYHLSISPLFEGEVMRMLEKRPEDRQSSPSVLLNDLRRVAKYENVMIE